MSLMHLSVSSFPFSLNGVAANALMVSVTDADGAPRAGLQRDNFEVRWIDNVNIDEPLTSITVAEYGTGSLPDLRGVYLIEVMSQQASWRTLTTFYIAVTEGGNHGQTLYRIDRTAYVQMN